MIRITNFEKDRDGDYTMDLTPLELRGYMSEGDPFTIARRGVLWWDSQDPNNTGWCLRIQCYRGGEWDGDSDIPIPGRRGSSAETLRRHVRRELRTYERNYSHLR